MVNYSRLQVTQAYMQFYREPYFREGTFDHKPIPQVRMYNHVILFVGKKVCTLLKLRLVGYKLVVRVKTFQLTTLIYRRGYIVYQHWCCTLSSIILSLKIPASLRTVQVI